MFHTQSTLDLPVVEMDGMVIGNSEETRQEAPDMLFEELDLTGRQRSSHRPAEAVASQRAAGCDSKHFPA